MLGSTTRAFLGIALTWSLLACASDRSSTSSGSKDAAPNPIRIQYVHYGSGQRLELIDQSRSSSADVYSKTRKLEDASTKVTTDEVLQETLDLFDSKGFFDKAERGASPAAGQGLLLQSFEVETPGRLVHLSVGKGTNPDDLKVFGECFKAFFVIYNTTYQLQSVDRAPDWESQNAKNAKKKPNG